MHWIRSLQHILYTSYKLWLDKRNYLWQKLPPLHFSKLCHSFVFLKEFANVDFCLFRTSQGPTNPYESFFSFSRKYKTNNLLFSIFFEIFSKLGIFEHDFCQLRPSDGSSHPHMSCFYLFGNIKWELPLLNIFRNYYRIWQTFKHVDVGDFRPCDGSTCPY